MLHPPGCRSLAMSMVRACVCRQEPCCLQCWDNCLPSCQLSSGSQCGLQHRAGSSGSPRLYIENCKFVVAVCSNFGPRHSTLHTNMRLRQHHIPIWVQDTAHHTQICVWDNTTHQFWSETRHTTHQFQSETQHSTHHTPVSVRDTAHQSIPFSTMQWFLIISRHPQMCVLWVHQSLDQTTFTSTPSVIQNHSTNITWSHQAQKCTSLLAH